MRTQLHRNLLTYYDQWVGAQMPSAYFDSDFLNFGYWRPDTRTRREASENLMNELLKLLPHRQGTILDVACGKGATTRHLMRSYHPANITGIDISDKHLDRCRANAPGCRFLKMDATDLAFDDASLDAVICVEAAPHFDTRERFLEEAYRVLRPGGHLALADVLLTELAHRVNPVLVDDNFVEGPTQYRELLRHAGFTGVMVRDVTEQSWIRHLENLLEFVWQQWRSGQVGLPYLARAAAFIRWRIRPAVRYYLLAGGHKPDERAP